MITKALLLFLLGFILLIKGGDWFVDGASGVAKRFKIPEIIIGATVVSIGTTIPEVMVSASAAFQGSSATAYGNAIGSVICNSALICGITITFKPSIVDKKPLILPVIFFFSAAIFYSIIAYAGVGFTRIVGIVLLLLFVAYVTLSLLSVKKTPAVIEAHEEKEENETTSKRSKIDQFKSSVCYEVLALVIGAVCIAFGANFLVDNCEILARAMGVPESVIALTLVALGTSLPELITAITSLLKGHGNLSLGNVIGANLFNLVLVSGLAITISPFSVPTEKLFMGYNASLAIDIPVMLTVMSVLTIPTLIKGKTSRIQGVVLLLICAAYYVFQFAI